VALTDEQLGLLRLVYDEFRKAGEWVRAAALQKKVWRTGMDVEAVADSLPEGFATRDYSVGGAIKLKIPALVAAGTAVEDLDNFMWLFRRLVERLDEDEPLVSITEVAGDRHLDASGIKRLWAILESEYYVVHPRRQDSNGVPGAWGAADDLWRLADAQTIEEYVRLKQELLRPRSMATAETLTTDSIDDLLERSTTAPAAADPTPRAVFVAYPWSAYPNREAYKAAYTSLEIELSVKFVFAESRLSVRHVLEKIDEMIDSTAFGIYDLTGWNPNVALEYGIARGRSRPAYIAFNPTIGNSTDVPADVRGYDRIQYADFSQLTSEVRRLVVQNLGLATSVKVF
jgi:hypothetical protein